MASTDGSSEAAQFSVEEAVRQAFAQESNGIGVRGQPAMVGVAMDVAQIKAALEYDAEFFINFFMGDQLSAPVPQFHKEIFYEMTHQTVRQYLVAIPRAHAKTTLAKLAALWFILFTPHRFLIYVSNTQSIAIPYVNDIIDFIESPNFRAIFGGVQWEFKRDGVGEYKFRILSLNKTCIIKAHGAGQQVRGINITHQRPDIAIVDDLESVDPQSGNINTEAQYRGLKRWLYGSFRKALAKGCRFLQLGNLLQRMSILWDHLQSPHWVSRLYGCLKADGNPLWPELWSLDELKQDFREYQEQGLADLWFAEMMNMPLAPGGGIIQAEEINYVAGKEPGQCSYGFLTVDLAISQQNWAHRCVVAAHGWVEEEQIWQIVEYRTWIGIDPIQLFREIVQMMMYWGFYVCGIESVAFQAALAPIYTFMAAEKGLHGIEFVPIAIGIQAKSARIITFAGLLKRSESHVPTYALTLGDFTATQQLLNYNPTKKENDDDVIDAMALGVVMMRLHMHLILNQMKGPIAQAAYQSVYQLSPV